MSQPFDARADLADSPDVGARVRPRDAATLILIRNGEARPEVLMGRRAPGHVFMASKWVFPGGRVERGDYTAPFATDLSPDELALLEREMPGFGELFRQLSFHEIGAAAMLSRALAGVARGKLLFALPGSEAACRLALEQLILPELGHMVGELGKA